MKKAKLILVLACSIAALSACVQKQNAAKTDSQVIADKFCAENFQSWKTVAEACSHERANGALGANCKTLNEVDVIIDKRRRLSVYKDCQAPEIRFGANAKNK